MFYDWLPNNAGIYRITHRRTGEQYIGASEYLKSRCASHRSGLLNGTHQLPVLANAFRGCCADDIEITILELVPMRQPPERSTDEGYDAWRRDRDHLLARERYWIETLRPSLNYNWRERPAREEYRKRRRASC